ncbi:MAG: elongation factor P [Candidatus Shikimatogenerans bostrichidophilus]|nr:MAG: elongation factor P [Candidatus Shikimatogenerans bostrichidophilus]
MLINISKIKKGICLEIKNKFFKIIDFLHVNPGKGNAFVRTRIKNLQNGNIIKKTFFPGTKINKIEIYSKHYFFLYKKQNNFFFINKINFNKINLYSDFIGDKSLFIKENDEVIINFIKINNNNFPLSLKINKYVVLKVIKTKIEIKGNTINKNYQKSILETGLSIYTPLFIKIGDNIKINTTTKEYIERIN